MTAWQRLGARSGSHLVLLAGAVLSTASFALIPLLSVSLPKAEAGLAGFYVALATFLAIPLGLGVPGSITTTHFAEDRGPGIARGIALRSGVLLTTGGFLLAVGGKVSVLASAVSIACSLAVLQNLLAVSRAEPDPARFLAATVSLGVLPMGISLAIAVWAGGTAASFLLAWSVIAALVSASWLTSLWVRHRPRFRSSLNLRFGLPLVAHGAGLVGLSVADRMVVGLILGPSTLAVYQLGYALGSLTPPVLNAWNNVLAPRIYRQPEGRRAATLAATTRRTSDLAWGVALLNLAFAVPAALALHSENYPWRTLLLIAAITTLSGLAYAGYLNTVHVYFLQENSRRLLFSTPSSMVLSVLVSAAFTTAWGIVGTAVASVIGYLTLWAATWWGCRRSPYVVSSDVAYPRGAAWGSAVAAIGVVAAVCLSS